MGPLALLLGRWGLANFHGDFLRTQCHSDPQSWHDPLLSWIGCHSRPLRNSQGLRQPPPCLSLWGPQEASSPALPAPTFLVHEPFSSLICPTQPAHQQRQYCCACPKGRLRVKPCFLMMVVPVPTRPRLGRRTPVTCPRCPWSGLASQPMPFLLPISSSLWG